MTFTPGAYTQAKAGRRADLGNIFFRSRYEANYARLLNYLIAHSDLGIVRWEHEPETFWFNEIKRGTRSYLPDFKVWFKDGSIEYHEVKGYDYARGRTARRRFLKYYPHLKLVLVDDDFFQDVHRKGFDKLIPEWEYKH